MTTLSPDEKSTLVMTYTQNMLVRGEVVTRQGVRVNTWLRTQGVPEYIHLFKATVLHFGSSVVKALTYAEVYVPVTTVIAFHLVPPVSEALDYSADEENRIMVPVTALPGTFQFKGYFRIATKATLSNSIETGAFRMVIDLQCGCDEPFHAADAANPCTHDFNEPQTGQPGDSSIDFLRIAGLKKK